MSYSIRFVEDLELHNSNMNQLSGLIQTNGKTKADKYWIQSHKSEQATIKEIN